MKLSAYVAQHGFDPFEPDDFKFVGSKVSRDPSRLILVGGQALETWGWYFDVIPPTGNRSPLTEDTDWLGGKSDAEWLCDLLGKQNTELQVAPMDDVGPSVALAYIERPGKRILMMDFLHTIAGLTNEEIKRLAVPIEVENIRINVLHPLLCVKSRLANLDLIPAKRHGNGPMQAEWAINIASAYLKRRAADLSQKKPAIHGCHAIREMAEYRHGRYCFVHHGIDPTKAVTPEIVSMIGGRFQELDWPLSLQRLKKKQARWLEIANRAKNSEVGQKMALP